MQKWGSIKRRHIAVKATAVETLQGQFSGYGSTASVVARTLDKLALKEPLEHWSNETIDKVVNAFTDEKFPTVIALNKIDHADADKNISKIAKMQDPSSIVLCSAISEVFLRKLAKQGFVRYTEGSEFVDTREDLIADGDPSGGGLKELDEKLKNRIENLKDMVLYRFGSTGVVQVLSRAAELLGLVPVFPVKHITSFGAGGGANSAVFRDCVLVKKNTTVAECARKVIGDAPLAYVEGAGGVRVAEDDVVAVGKNDVSAPSWALLVYHLVPTEIANNNRSSPLKSAERNKSDLHFCLVLLEGGRAFIGRGAWQMAFSDLTGMNWDWKIVSSISNVPTI